MIVVQQPAIQFHCHHCGAVNQGEPHEFRERNTTPPTWLARCGSCRLDSAVSPTPLIARKVARMFGR